VNIAVVGPFDVPSLSAQLTRRVVEAELRDRCPDVRVHVFAPSAGVAGLDPVTALDPPDAGRLAAFHDRFPFVVVAGDPAASASWLAPSQRAVRVTGEAGFLAARWMTADVLAARREFLVGMGWWPSEGGSVAVVQGSHGAHAHMPTDHVVLVEAEPGDEGAGTRRISLRAGATADDVVAAIANADVVVAEAPSVRAVAAAFDRPVVPETEAASAQALVLDEQFDALCREVTGREPERFATAERDALRRALDARGRRLATERAAMADRVWAIERHLEGEVAARDARIAALEAERDALRSRIEVRARAALGRVIRAPRNKKP
jgi:hypothetical protein